MALRAPTQAGFRPKHSLEDLVLVLQTVVQHAIISKQQLALCFVDLAKAYDSIPRTQLWYVLCEELNIPNFLVQLFCNIYYETLGIVSGGDSSSANVPMNKGVK